MADTYGAFEKQLVRLQKHIVGVDEVGRGALAGPVYAGAAILDFAKLFKLSRENRSLIRDSKSLTHAQRQKSLLLIHKVAKTYAVGSADIREIESLGITQASFLAMRRALAKLTESFDVLLIDGKLYLPNVFVEQHAIIGGDASCFSIAAASILAKEARDELMREESPLYPAYGFDSHVGYATEKHLNAIHEHGPCAIHRKSFDPIKALIKRDHSPPLLIPDSI